MRYLVFNLLVVGALAFMLFDGKPPQTAREAVDKIVVQTDRLIEKGKELAANPAPTPEPILAPKPAPEPPVTRTADQVPAPAPKAKPPVARPMTAPAPVAPPAPVKPVAVTSRPAETTVPSRADKKLPPDVARRRAEILGTANEGVATPPSPTVESAFMTPRQRRGELSKLAEDMELLFVEKSGQ
jgi:outer membrane biosynthesis protein TonB